MTSTPTHLLVESAQAGERSAFDELAERYRDRLQSFIRSRLGARMVKIESLEDIQQETWLRVFQSMERFQWKGLEGQESITLSGDVVGTPLYMSPEQARRRKIRVDHRTDVYSLGATMYEMLTFRPPFRGRDHQETLSQIITRDPVELRKHNPRVPRGLETIVLKCLRKDPQDRYGTAEALAQDLRRFVRGDPVEARPEPAWEVLSRRFRRHKALVTTVVCALLFIATTGLLVHGYFEKIEEANKNNYERLVLEAVVNLELAEESKPQRGSASFDSDQGTWVQLAERAVAELEEAIELFPGRPEATYHLATALHLLGQNAAAEKALERLDPEFLPAAVLKMELVPEAKERAAAVTVLVSGEKRPTWEKLWYSAHQALKDESWKGAADAYGRLIEQFAGDTDEFLGTALESRLGRGRAFLRDENYENALMEFAVAAALWPDLTAPPYFLGETFLLMERPERAEELFESLHQRARFPDVVATSISSLYHERKAWKEALQWTGKVKTRAVRARGTAHHLSHLKRLDEALEAARTSLKFDPDRPDIYILMGDIYRQQRKFDEAIAYLDKGLELFAALPELSYSYYDAAAGYYCRGMAYSAMRQRKKAIDDLSESIRLDGEVHHPFHLRGRLHQRLGEKQKAIDDFTQAIRLNSTDTESLHLSYNMRGNLYQDFGKFDEAIEDFTEATRLDLNCATCYSCRGSVYCRQGKYEEAIEDLTQAIQRKPDDLVSWYRRAHLYLVTGQLDAYRETCRKMLDRFGKNEEPGDAFLVAWTCVLLPDAAPDLSRAVTLANKAVEGDSDSLSHSTALGAALYRAGRFDDAARRLTELDELMQDPDSSSQTSPAYCWFFLAMTHHRLGHHKAAREYFDKAVQWTDNVVQKQSLSGGTSVSWRGRLRFKVLREEAQALLNVSESSEQPETIPRADGN